jgi:hypothetical protein
MIILSLVGAFLVSVVMYLPLFSGQVNGIILILGFVLLIFAYLMLSKIKRK